MKKRLLATKRVRNMLERQTPKTKAYFKWLSKIETPRAFKRNEAFNKKLSALRAA